MKLRVNGSEHDIPAPNDMRLLWVLRLVLWGWSPGVGRAPVSVPHEKFVAKFKTWIAAGAPCAP